MKTELSTLIENLVIMTLIDTKVEKDELVLLQKLLNTPEWFFEFSFDEKELKSTIKKLLVNLQLADNEALHIMFEANTKYLKKALDKTLYDEYSKLILEFTTTLNISSQEEALLRTHKDLIKSPMSQLRITRFEEYIEALMIYALVDEKSNSIPQQEAIIILNEIKSYTENSYKSAKEEFFRLYKKTLKNSKKHMSIRFSGVMVENFLKLSDAQDKHLLHTLSRIANVNANHSTQEKSFNAIVKKALSRAKLIEGKNQ